MQIVFYLEDELQLDKNHAYQLFQIIRERKNFSVVDPKSFAETIELLSEYTDIRFSSKLNIGLFDMFQLFIDFLRFEEDILKESLFPSDFYSVIANINIIKDEGKVSGKNKEILMLIANKFKDVYLEENKNGAEEFKNEEGENIKGYILIEIENINKNNKMN